MDTFSRRADIQRDPTPHLHLVTILHPEHLAEIKQLVAAVRQHLGKHGANLVRSKSLAGAKRRYHRFWQGLGLAGDQASHSARYWYTQRAVEYRLDELGMHPHDALSRTANDLGHGSRRATWVVRIYTNNKADRVSKQK